MTEEAPRANAEHSLADNYRILVFHRAHDAGMKRGGKWAVAMSVLAVVLIVLCVPAHFGMGSCTLTTRAGLLDQDCFLDCSRSIFQSTSWHIGDATKCWGDTYGIKVGKFYWSFEVMHGRPEDGDP